MAYTQNLGRGNNAKTGSGVPSALLQKNIKSGKLMTRQEGLNSINSVTSGNKNRINLESTAKNDSIVAAGARKLSGGNEFQQGLQGNLAANRTRVAGGAGDMAVLRGRTAELYGSTAGGPNTATYTRKGPVEKDITREAVEAYGSNRGELDPMDAKTIKELGKALAFKKSSPNRQMKKKK